MNRREPFLPHVIKTDRGTEFINKTLSEKLKAKNVQVRSGKAYSSNTQGVIERVHGTIRETLARVQTAHGGVKGWVRFIPDIVHNYNHSVHSSIGATPDSVHRPLQEYELAKIRDKLWEKYNKQVEKITPASMKYGSKTAPKVGDLVRIRLPRSSMTPTETARWSSETYKVIGTKKIGNEIIPRFIVMDPDTGIQKPGLYAHSQVLKVKAVEKPLRVPAVAATARPASSSSSAPQAPVPQQARTLRQGTRRNYRKLAGVDEPK